MAVVRAAPCSSSPLLAAQFNLFTARTYGTLASLRITYLLLCYALQVAHFMKIPAGDHMKCVLATRT